MGLRGRALALSPEEAKNIVTLWNGLSPHDKGRISETACHQYVHLITSISALCIISATIVVIVMFWTAFICQVAQSSPEARLQPAGGGHIYPALYGHLWQEEAS